MYRGQNSDRENHEDSAYSTYNPGISQGPREIIKVDWTTESCVSLEETHKEGQGGLVINVCAWVLDGIHCLFLHDALDE